MSPADIPDFEDAKYKGLIENLCNGACIFFGAGVSKLAGFKLWNELANDLIDRFWDRRDEMDISKVGRFDYSFKDTLKKHPDEVEKFDYLFRLDDVIFKNEMNQIFKIWQDSINKEVFYTLNKLNNENNFFVTTNLDMEFQKYIGLEDNQISIAPHFLESPRKINYLHGRIDKTNSWVFTRRSYIKSYSVNGAPCMSFIRDIFEKYCVLFIGYGLCEKEILDGIIKSGKQRCHYWLELSDRNRNDYLEIRATTLKDNYNITVIPYYIDNYGETLLYKVITKLYTVFTKRIGGKHA